MLSTRTAVAGATWLSQIDQGDARFANPCIDARDACGSLALQDQTARRLPHRDHHGPSISGGAETLRPRVHCEVYVGANLDCECDAWARSRLGMISKWTAARRATIDGTPSPRHTAAPPLEVRAAARALHPPPPHKVCPP